MKLWWNMLNGTFAAVLVEFVKYCFYGFAVGTGFLAAVHLWGMP